MDKKKKKTEKCELCNHRTATVIGEYEDREILICGLCCDSIEEQGILRICQECKKPMIYMGENDDDLVFSCLDCYVEKHHDFENPDLFNDYIDHLSKFEDYDHD